MDAGAWYVTAFVLGAGAAIFVYWTLALVFGRLPLPSSDHGDPELHVLAESITAIALITAGLARLMTTAAWVGPVTGIGLGALVYALIGSPAFYPRNKEMRAAFAVGWVFTIPAIALLLVSA